MKRSESDKNAGDALANTCSTQTEPLLPLTYSTSLHRSQRHCCLRPSQRTQNRHAVFPRISAFATVDTAPDQATISLESNSLVTARSELRKVLFLVPSVSVFCLHMKYLENR